ncbi:DinB family protein [Nocardiopsis sp. NPDC058789]|uniref:DinB family protein n=1 Tax=Nocardiopsis eucommiae TaxID=2831970 RepID=A0A975QKY8_9ACTN|nr:DinB family protein [Nocardiopsis eucommiae]
MGATNNQVNAERESLLTFLAQQRAFLLTTLRGLDQEEATRRTTRSELCLAGIVKHVTQMEEGWVRFIEEGPQEVDYESQETLDHHENSFRLIGEETLEGTLAAYERQAEATDAYVRGLPDLEVSQKLPAAPWFPEDTSWTARDVVIHLIRETAQHCGHADIIRESLDGQKTMG